MREESAFLSSAGSCTNFFPGKAWEILPLHIIFFFSIWSCQQSLSLYLSVFVHKSNPVNKSIYHCMTTQSSYPLCTSADILVKFCSDPNWPKFCSRPIFFSLIFSYIGYLSVPTHHPALPTSQPGWRLTHASSKTYDISSLHTVAHAVSHSSWIHSELSANCPANIFWWAKAKHTCDYINLTVTSLNTLMVWYNQTH